MDINWGLLRPTDVAGSFQQGYQQGEQIKRQKAQENALMQVAKNPDDPSAVNALLPYDPRTAMALRNDQTDRMKLRATQQQDQHKQLNDAIGQAALHIMTLPVEQRPQAWDAYVGQFEQSYPEAAQYRGHYSDQAALAILANTGLMQKYQEMQQPKYMAIPEGGTLVNTRDPGAVQSFGQGAQPQPIPAQPPQQGSKFMAPQQVAPLLQSMGPQGFVQWQQKNNVPVQVNGPQDVANLPSGTLMVSPDGRTGVKR